MENHTANNTKAVSGGSKPINDNEERSNMNEQEHTEEVDVYDNGGADEEEGEKTGSGYIQSPHRPPSRTPFTNLSQVDADLALARALQEEIPNTHTRAHFKSLGGDPTDERGDLLNLVCEGGPRCCRRWGSSSKVEDQRYPSAVTTRRGRKCRSFSELYLAPSLRRSMPRSLVDSEKRMRKGTKKKVGKEEEEE